MKKLKNLSGQKEKERKGDGDRENCPGGLLS